MMLPTPTLFKMPPNLRIHDVQLGALLDEQIACIHVVAQNGLMQRCFPLHGQACFKTMLSKHIIYYIIHKAVLTVDDLACLTSAPCLMRAAIQCVHPRLPAVSSPLQSSRRVGIVVASDLAASFLGGGEL